LNFSSLGLISYLQRTYRQTVEDNIVTYSQH